MIMIDNDSCVNCGVCSGLCPTDAIVDNCGTMTIDMDICVECGACIAGCPTEAISSVGVVTGNTESAYESQYGSGQTDEYRQSGNKMNDLPVLMSIDYSDIATKTYLNIYPGFVKIHKPKYERITAFGIVKRLAGIQKDIEAVFPFSEIEAVEIIVQPTRHATGIIQFFLKNHKQSRANFFNLAFRTDAIQFWYKDRQIVEHIILFINAIIKLHKGETPSDREVEVLSRTLDGYSLKDF